MALSRNEQIISDTIAGVKTTMTPMSRIEVLLLELQDAVISGGGGGGSKIRFQKVDSFEALPAIGEDGVIYLVPNENTDSKNIYDEYFWQEDHYEVFGERLTEDILSQSGGLTKDDQLTDADVIAEWNKVFGNS